MSANPQRDAIFLEEMGIGPLWTLRHTLPAGDAAAPAQAAGEGASVQPAAAVAKAASAAETSLPADIAGMNWDQLNAAIASCTRCGLCKGGAKPVLGRGARQAKWLVAAGATSARDEQEAMPLSGDAAVLLGNMLAAVGLSADDSVYVTNLIKCRPSAGNGSDRAPTAEEAAACRPYLERELVLSGAKQVLTMGQIAANGVRGEALAEPLSGSRGTVYEFNGVPLVATLHPGELLLRGGDKALAWADLCLAKSVHDAV